jgi:antitoxin CptB
MRELDAVLSSFLQSAGPKLGEADLARFEAILELPDPELLAYLAGRSAPTDPDAARLIELIRSSPVAGP